MFIKSAHMFGLSLLSRLPFPVLYRLSDGLFFLTAYVFRYRRAVIQTNLQRAFPDAPPGQIRALTLGFYRNFCDIIVETIKLPAMHPEDMRRRVVLTNPELVEAYLRAGQTVLGVGAHQGNWEWVPASALVLGLPVDSVYKPLSNATSERLMQQIRQTFGAHLIPMPRLARELASRRHLPRLIALVADQMPNIPSSAHWTMFLNQDTPFFPGTERLARSLQLPVVYLDLVRVKRGYYTATFSLLAEPPYANLPPGTIIDRYRDRLTQAITHQPANWLWSHKRWKHKREEYAKTFTRLD